MNQNLKKMLSYYKSHMKEFLTDMFFASLSAAIALTIPLIIRYVTSQLIYMETHAIAYREIVDVYICDLIQADINRNVFVINVKTTVYSPYIYKFGIITTTKNYPSYCLRKPSCGQNKMSEKTMWGFFVLVLLVYK